MTDFDLLFGLFRHSLAALAVVAVGAPVVGAFLFARRAGFHGVVLPQFATTGVALGYAALPWWVETFGLHEHSLAELVSDPHHVEGYLQAWAVAATLVGALAASRARRGTGSETAWLAALFAGATAATTIVRARTPFAGEAVDALLGGEVLLADPHGVGLVTVALAAAVALVLTSRRALLLDVLAPDVARVAGLSRLRIDLVLALASASTVGVGVSVVGPYATFGSLVIAPLAARRWARSFRGFVGLSAAFGLLAALLGTALSFGPLDLPLGPAVVAAGLLTLAPHLFGRARA